MFITSDVLADDLLLEASMLAAPCVLAGIGPGSCVAFYGYALMLSAGVCDGSMTASWEVREIDAA